MPETNEAAPRRFHWGRFFLFLAIVAAVVLVALYSFFHIDPLNAIKNGFGGVYQKMVQTVGESNQKVSVVFSNDAGEQLSYGTVASGIAVCSSSTVRFYDSAGDQRWYVPVSLKKPLIRTDGNDILVADIEGRYFGIIRDGKILWEKTLDLDIVNAGISGNWILIVTGSGEAGYKRSIHAFSRDGEEIAFRNISDFYPFIVYHYPQFDPADFIVCGLETDGLKAASLFEFLDLSMTQKGSLVSPDGDEVFTGALPLGEGKLLLFGNKSVTCVDKTFSTVWSADLSEDLMTASGVTPKGTTVIAVLDGELLNREKRSQTAIRMINTQGKVAASVEMDAPVTGINISGRTIACVAGSEVYFMNETGEIMDMYTSASPVEGVYMANESLAYVVTGSKVLSVKVNVKNKFLGIF